MWGNIALFALKLILEMIPIFLGKSQKKAEYERLVKASIYVWEKRTGRASKLRQDHRTVDEKLKEKWQEKWGSRPNQ